MIRNFLEKFFFDDLMIESKYKTNIQGLTVVREIWLHENWLSGSNRSRSFLISKTLSGALEKNCISFFGTHDNIFE